MQNFVRFQDFVLAPGENRLHIYWKPQRFRNFTIRWYFFFVLRFRVLRAVAAFGESAALSVQVSRSEIRGITYPRLKTSLTDLHSVTAKNCNTARKPQPVPSSARFESGPGMPRVPPGSSLHVKAPHQAGSGLGGCTAHPPRP